MTAEPDRQLWCAVIGQAVDDAICSLGPNRRRNHEITNARNWLTRPNRDFADVCSAAGYEPDRIRARAIGRIDEAKRHDCPPPPLPPKPRKPRAPNRVRATTNEGQEANVARSPL